MIGSSSSAGTEKGARYNRGTYAPRGIKRVPRGHGPVADPPPGGLVAAICPVVSPGDDGSPSVMEEVPFDALETVAAAYGYRPHYMRYLAGIAQRSRERRASLGKFVRREARGLIDLASLFDGAAARLGGPAAARAWLDSPHPELPGQRSPSDFLETAAGIAMVRSLLERREFLAAAAPQPAAPLPMGEAMARDLAVPAIADAASLIADRGRLLGWLREPNARMGGRCPAEVIATPWGASRARALVEAVKDGVPL